MTIPTSSCCCPIRLLNRKQSVPKWAQRKSRLPYSVPWVSIPGLWVRFVPREQACFRPFNSSNPLLQSRSNDSGRSLGASALSGPKLQSFSAPTARRDSKRVPRDESNLTGGPLVDHLAIEDGHFDFGLLDCLGRNCEDVVGKLYQVGKLARFDGSFDRFLVFGECRSHGVGMNRLRNADTLLGDPALWVLAVDGAARGGSIDTHHGIQGRDRPVGTESEFCSCIEQGFPCIARFDTLRANDSFSPPAVVDCVVGLHGSDDAGICEAGIVLRLKMLTVPDAGARMGRTIIFFQAGIEIEYGAVRAIANGVDRKLESRFVGLAHRFIEMLDVEKVGAGEAALSGDV